MKKLTDKQIATEFENQFNLIIDCIKDSIAINELRCTTGGFNDLSIKGFRKNVRERKKLLKQFQWK